MNNKHILFKKAKIVYTVQGQGDVVFLVHGFLSSKQTWNYIGEQLARDYKVVCIDLPGFGESECIALHHTMSLMAEVIHQVCLEENIINMVVAGHSMGGYVSLALADKYPDLVKGLLLFHSHASADTDEVKENRRRTVNIVKNDGLKFINNFTYELYAPENVEALDDIIKANIDNANNAPKDGIVAALTGMAERNDHLKLLMDFNKPIGFIAGKQDSRIPLAKTLAQIGLVKHAEILVLDECGHMGMDEKPEECYKFLKGFVYNCI
ncbi:MAG: alpha/beta fold hydrolase [Hyphomicrobiales bacterium]